ncbi:hypothetical protein [Rhodococcus sp. JS3073]|uniref:hypothetical protein n=1 Tax=Rhodococcus sp. JS3073 TaxID=3002901 RepID=UPI002286B91E|nr:hypothetical protein [Rhodococcus sp. JS3073]WAM19955.1 hypothetical protein OYT95_40690 [Rhodococcus sp. JS3073]
MSNNRDSRPRPAPPQEATKNDDQIDNYRRLRRRKQWDRTRNERFSPRSENAELIHFANTWAPYGGASDEDILVAFGMSKNRFHDALRHALHQTGCHAQTIEQLTAAYSRTNLPARKAWPANGRQ